MSAPSRLVLVAAVLAVLTLALAACGGSDEAATGATTAAGSPQPLPAGLEASVEAETVAFLAREGTALRESLRPYLGPRPATAVERGSAICRPGTATASIADADRYPFACVVRGSASAGGLEVEVTLGFVGTELDGECWRAANERVAATTTTPALLTREEAMRAVNQIAGCAVPEVG